MKHPAGSIGKIKPPVTSARSFYVRWSSYMENIDKQILNPWFAIWTKPRETIQYIIDTNPKRFVLLLACIGGISFMFARAEMKNLGNGSGGPLPFYVIILAAVIMGPLWGMINLFVSSALLHWTGKRLGGNAPGQNIRAAVAWSHVPAIAGLIIWIIGIAIFGRELFMENIPTITDGNLLLSLTYLLFCLARLVLIIWSIFIAIKCIAQVQGFSTWKALSNIGLSIIIVAIPILTIWGIKALIQQSG